MSELFDFTQGKSNGRSRTLRTYNHPSVVYHFEVEAKSRNPELAEGLNVITLSGVEVRQMRQYKRNQLLFLVKLPSYK